MYKSTVLLLVFYLSHLVFCLFVFFFFFFTFFLAFFTCIGLIKHFLVFLLISILAS